MADFYGPPAPGAGYTGDKPKAPILQRMEETYFAGQKPSEEDLLGFRSLFSKYTNSTLSENQLLTLAQNARSQNLDLGAALGEDYYTNKLAKQISNQRNTLGTEKYYAGDLVAIGGIDSATSYMASRLVRSGIRDLSEIGERPVQEDGVTTGKQIYNKRTGEPLKQGNDAQYYYAVNTIAPDANQYIFGGTFAGKNTSLNISMVDGLPVFYTTPGPASGDFNVQDIAPMVAVASLMMPGVGQAIGSFVVEAALGTAAAQGMSAAALGAIGSGVLTTVLTGDVKQGVLASAGTYLGAQMGDIIGETAKGIFDSPAGQKFAQSMGTAMTRAAVLGQDVSEAAMGAAAGEALNLVTGSLPGFSDIKDPKTKLAITEAIQAGLSQPGSLSDRISSAALQGAVTLGASQFESGGKKFVDLDPGQKTLVTSALTAALSGKPLDQALIQSAVSNVQSEFARTLKQPTAAQPEDFGYQPGVQDQPMIDDLGFKPSPDVSPVTPSAPVATEAVSPAPVTPSAPVSTEVVSPATVVLPTGVTGAEIPFRRETFFGDFPQLAFDPETGLIIPPRPIQVGERVEGQPDVFGPQLPRTFPTLDPSAGVVTDVGPPITRQELISDPNQPSRQVAPGSISGEVPIQRETILDADKAEKTRQEISDEVFAELVKNFQEVNPSTLRLASDLALDYSSFDPNIPTPMSDMAQQNKSLIAQGVSDAYKNLTEAAPILLKLQVDANRVDQAQKTLSRFDLIDEGKLNEAIAPIKSFPLGLKVLSEYNSASPERRAEMRGEQSGVIQNSVGAATEALRLYEQYKQDRNKDRIAVPEFTDIRTDNIKDLASDFSKWLQYNVGAGSVSTATVMLGALIGGPLGALAASVPMGTSEALANRMQYLSEVYKGKNPDETASSILSYLNKTGETNLIIGAASGVLDLMGPVGSALRRQAGASLIKDVVERPVVGALKNVPKEMLEEAFTGAMQELTQIFGEQYLGEQEGPVFSVANGKRLINSAAAEAAGSLSGSGINIATASGAEQWKNKTIEIAKEHAADEVQAGKVLYPDVLNPATPEEASSSKRALEKLSDPATTAQVTEFDIYGSGFSEVPINKPAFGVKSSTQTLEGSTVYNLGDGYAALEDAFGGIKVINEAGRVVPLTANEITDLYDTVIEPYKKQQLTKEVAKPVDQVVDTTGTVVDTSGVRPAAPVDTATGTVIPAGATPAVVTPPTGAAQPVVTDTSRPTDTTGNVTRPVNTQPATSVSTSATNGTATDTSGTNVGTVVGTSKATDTGTPTVSTGTTTTTDTTGGATVTTPVPLTEAQIQKIVNDTILANPSLSESDVKKIVGNAIATIPGGITAADVKNVVDAAITNLPKSPTAQDLATAVSNATAGLVKQTDLDAAIASIKFPESLSQEDVRSIVSQVMQENPGISMEGVQQAIQSALDGLPQSATPTDVATAVSGVESKLVAAIDQAKQQGLAGDQALQSGIDKVATELGTTKEALLSQLGKSEADLRTEFRLGQQTTQGQIAEVQKSLSDAIAANEAAGLSRDAAITKSLNDVATSLGTTRESLLSQLGTSEQTLRSEFTSGLQTTQSQLSQQMQQQYDNLTSAQKAEVEARVQQGQNLQNAIENVSTQTTEQISNVRTALESQISTLGTQTQQQYQNLSDAQKQQALDLARTTGDLTSAINQVSVETGQQIAGVQTALEAQLKALRDQQEAERKAAEEAAKAAEEQSRQRTLLNLGTSMLGGAAGAGILGGLGALGAAPTTTALPPLKGLTTGEATKDEFVSPLAAFQKQIGLTPQQETKPEEQDRTMPYFSYGQPSEVASVLNLQDEEEQLVAKGGLITPLMASGGLPVVHYAGKPRMDFRRGAYVQGPGDGQSDDIPAMLADGEYVFDAETVAALGNGSNKAGAKLLDKMREQIRAHKRGGSLKKIPPASKSPLEYLAMAKR